MGKVENSGVRNAYGFLFELQELEREIPYIQKDLEKKKKRVEWLKTKVKEQ